jgi:undecaprenyl-diphosphatase
MRLWEACLLGAIQGATEFLPVSSSGHLAVALHFLPTPSADPVAVEVALHAGTLAAVLAYFRADLLAMALGLLRPAAAPTHARRWIWLLGVATLPTALVYVVFGRWIEAAFGSLTAIGTSFIVTGLLLVLPGRTPGGRRGDAELDTTDALVVGAFQGLALLPGISRSGATITGGLLRGLGGETAARFSFLLSIPAIVGAELTKAPALAAEAAAGGWPLAAGTVVAAVVGWVAIDVLLRLVRRGKLLYFASYCGIVGALTLGAALGGW